MSAAVPGTRFGTARACGRRVLPGFGPALGFTLTYLSLLVLIPLAGRLPARVGHDRRRLPRGRVEHARARRLSA